MLNHRETMVVKDVKEAAWQNAVGYLRCLLSHPWIMAIFLVIKSHGNRDKLKPKNADILPAFASLRKNRMLLQAR